MAKASQAEKSVYFVILCTDFPDSAPKALSEQCAECVAYLGDFVDVYGETGSVEPFEGVSRYQDVGHTELLGLGYTLLYARDRAYFTRETHFSGHTPSPRYGHVDIAR